MASCLLGHLHRLLRASGAAAEVWADQVPLLPGAAGLAAAGFISGGTRANTSYLADAVNIEPDTDPVAAEHGHRTRSTTSEHRQSHWFAQLWAANATCCGASSTTAATTGTRTSCVRVSTGR